MHVFLATLLIAFAGWTLSSHLVVLAGWSLKVLILIAPFLIGFFALIYQKLASENDSMCLHEEPLSISFSDCGDFKPHNVSLVVLCCVPVILYISWIGFWATSILLLAYCSFRNGINNSCLTNKIERPDRWEWIVISFVSLFMVILTLTSCRSDLDDAFYVAVAAFASGNPGQPLLVVDPMHGETNLPLIFPSYRFASFELLSAAVANLLNIPAMNVYYILLPPLGMIAAVFAIFLLARELMPNRWLFVGIVTLLLTILLGEMHRAPANFSFPRIFQGKAVYLSVVMPAIFYLTARYFSKRGRRADLFLLGCCQMSAIGLSNFGMLAAPMAGFSALISNIPIAWNVERKKILWALGSLVIPLPYLIDVAIQSNGAQSIANFPYKSASQIWSLVFGSNQQYLAGILLLSGPVLARDYGSRYRLSLPPLFFFVIYLNPWFSHFISKNITTPALYWRVTWSFPVLIFAAVSICAVIDQLIFEKGRRFSLVILASIVALLITISLPVNTLRSENTTLSWKNFAGKKIPPLNYAVAEKTIMVNGMGHRVLAPEEISGVISRFESHPKLVSVRMLYLQLLGSALGSEGFHQRRILHKFVGSTAKVNYQIVSAVLIALDVSTIVMPQGSITNDKIGVLMSENYEVREEINGYSIFHKNIQ